MKKKYLETKIKLFKQAIDNNRLSHLYLISGPKGSGKKELAYQVASLLLKTDVESLEKGHINLHYIEPTGQNIKVEQINNLQAEFSKTSLIGGYRMFILNQVDKLNQTSANRLLKFLEEPTDDKTIGFMLTENIELVISTILSRSQIVYLPSLEEIHLANILQTKGVDKLAAELLPYLNKDIDELLVLSEDANIKMLIAAFQGFINALKTEENLWLYYVKNLKDIRYNRDLTKYFLQFLMIFYLDIYKMKNKEAVSLTSFIEKYQTLEVIDSEYLQDNLLKIQDLLQKINYNINVDMALSQLIIEIG